MNKVITLSEEEWEVLKKFAKVRRKELGRGFTVHDALKLMVEWGMAEITRYDAYDQDGNEIDWL